jgi:hypothetical protein
MIDLSQSRQRWLNPLTFSTNAAFVLIATLFLSIAGWLMHFGILPSFEETSLSLRYSPWNTLIPLEIWMKLAVSLAFMLPIFALLICWGWRVVRYMLLFYLAVMLLHIFTEMIFSKLGLPRMNYLVGFTYTSYKIWQFWSYKQYIHQQKQIKGRRRNILLIVFIVNLVFWTLNWLFLGINLVTRSIGV